MPGFQALALNLLSCQPITLLDTEPPYLVQSLQVVLAQLVYLPSPP